MNQLAALDTAAGDGAHTTVVEVAEPLQYKRAAKSHSRLGGWSSTTPNGRGGRTHPWDRGDTHRHDDGLGAVRAPFLTGLTASAHTSPPDVAGRLAASVLDLFGTLVAERTRTGVASTARKQPVLRVRGHIERHLEGPELTTETLASAHHISVGYLHRLFEDEHLTVDRLIQRHQLQMCAREPAGGDGTTRAVSTVAQRAA
ncbi:hypothetical protein [Streptomyces sp. NPDC051452]|uniref:hypothetical protein n=1 Tax=Streptomyces sp. NPDC051452 TaxID=3365654 RepID=UPI00379D17C9